MKLKKVLKAIAVCSLLTISLVVKGQQTAHEVRGLKHAGGVHFYPSIGAFEVTIFKEDGKGDPINQIMHATLFGPDGSSLDSMILYGNTEKTLKVSIEEKGIYTLLVSMNNDQRISTVKWGFKTITPLYMINSSAGHTDRTRTEPIVLEGGKQPFGIFFKPKKDNFRISATNLPKNARKIHLFDGSDKLIKEIKVKDNKIDEDIQCGSCDGVWELRLPQQIGTVNIEGVTFGWGKNVKPLSVWTTNRQSYFDVDRYHWLLSPRRFARNVHKGDEGTVEFSLFNNSNKDMSLNVRLAQIPKIGKFKLTANDLTIPANSTSSLNVEYQLDSSMVKDIYDMLLIAEDRHTGKQAFSLVEFRVDTKKTLSLPIELKLFEHDQFQFAYEPNYPRDNQFYFDPANRPWLVSSGGLKVKIGEKWETVAPLENSENVRYPTSTIGFDNEGFAYTVISIKNEPYVLRANSESLDTDLTPLPHGGVYKMETYMGGKTSDYPPAIVRYRVDPEQRRVSKWARVHRLELLLIDTKQGELYVGEPILISDNCIGTSDHSGITNAIASDGDELHLIWGATSDPTKSDIGVPTYTASYNRKTKRLSQFNLLAYSPPVNDVHNMSSILIDSHGTKHVIIGAHGRPFQYLTQSKKSKVWSKPSPISDLGQTYVGAVLDKRDGIHLFCRTWRTGADYPGIFDASLFFQHKQGGGNIWQEQQPFALPALPGYTVYYHRVTVDRNGKVYLSMDYWPTWSIYRESYRDSNKNKSSGKNRLVFTSADGEAWKLLREIE